MDTKIDDGINNLKIQSAEVSISITDMTFEPSCEKTNIMASA